MKETLKKGILREPGNCSRQNYIPETLKKG